IASKCSSESKSCLSLILNKKLEVIKLREKDGLKARSLVANRQVVNAKEKFLKKIKSGYSSKHVNDKKNSLIADMEKVFMIWIDDQDSYNIPLSQSLIQSKVLTLFNSMKSKRGEEAAEEKIKTSRGWFRFRDRNHLHNIKVQGEVARADIEAAANYPEDLVKIMMKVSTIFFFFFYWKKMSSKMFIAREKLMTDFKASKDRLTLLLGANFELKPMLIYHYENSRALQKYAKSTLPMVYKWNNKAWKTLPLFTYFNSPLLRPSLQEKKKKDPFKIVLLIDNVPSHPRILMTMYKEINVVFIRTNTASSLQPIDQRVISIFESYCLRNTLYTATAAIDSDSFDGSGKSKLKTFKTSPILGAIRNMCESWEEIKMSTLTGMWKKFILTLTDDIEGFKISMGKINTDEMEIARELEVKPEDVTICCNFMIKLEWVRDCFPQVSKGGDFLRWNYILIITSDLEYYINLVDKAVTMLERIDSNFERSSTVGKILSHIVACYRETFCERKSHSILHTSMSSYFNKIATATATTTFSNHHSASRQDPPPAKRL
uniref:HTH CENPB-type domain-containing protein n=1 Tax=Chlorocebus sabaeus TaxID=60711 RepID=A0A0D9RBC0_CHLSB